MKTIVLFFLSSFMVFLIYCFLNTFEFFGEVQKEIWRFLKPYWISTKIVFGRVFRLSIVLSVLSIFSYFIWIVLVCFHIIVCSLSKSEIVKTEVVIKQDQQVEQDHQVEPIQKPTQNEQNTTRKRIKVLKNEDSTMT